MARGTAVVMGDLGLVRALAMAGVRSVVVTQKPDDITLRSRYVVGSQLVPGWTEQARARTAGALVELGARLRRETEPKIPLFYGNDPQLELMHEHRGALSEHFAFLINDEALGRALLDKERFAELAARAGVPIPRSAPLDDRDAVRALRLPLVVKPRAKLSWYHLRRELFGGWGKGRVFSTREELEREPLIAAHAGELLAQELVPGDVRDLVSFHGFVDAWGDLRAWFCGRKIRTHPPVAGESCFIELTRDAEVERLGRDVIGRLGVRGVFKIDLIRDSRDGALYVLEINARFNLWDYLGAAHGVNLLGVAYDYLTLGRVAPQRPYVPRYRWLNLYRDVRACRDAREQGRLRYVRWATSLATAPKVYEAFAWRDPRPFAHWAVDYLKKKVA